MADNYEKRSGKSTRQRKSKSLRQTVVQVRMNDEEIALLDSKRGTESRSLFLRRALHDDARNNRELVTVRVPELEGVRMDLKRIGVNANQIARRYNMEAKNARPWSTMSAPAGTREDVKSFEEFTQELRKTNTLLEQLNESVRKQTMEMQLSELYPEVRALLEDFGDATHLPDVVDELLSDERHEVGGDV